MGNQITTSNQRQNIISTSNELLIEAQWPQLNVNEQRLVLYMLSLIKRDDKDFTTYRIAIKDLSNILGGRRKDLYKKFDEATDGLMKKVIRWNNPNEKHRVDKCTWCSSASVIPGQGSVELRFDPTLKPFLLALKGNFTTWGEARAVIGLKNHYSLRIYQFIKYNQGLATVDRRTSATVELSWFRNYLAIPETNYKLFGHFKSKVLVPSQKDIAAKTDVVFEFEQLKLGRKVHKLKFTWEENDRFKQMELPGISGDGKSSLEDILVFEFGLTPEKKANQMIQEYGNEHIKLALQAVRDYILNLKKGGKKVHNPAGIARKAIEEGWKPSKPTVEKQVVLENLKTIEAVEIKKQKEIFEDQERKRLEVEQGDAAEEQFEQLSSSEQKDVLKGFREYLVDQGNMPVLRDFEEHGVAANVVIKLLFRVYLKENLLKSLL